jgi:exopolyphosphatase/guanosine-5'-triphosphate,3'-diphosphate pyrophosphatase
VDVETNQIAAVDLGSNSFHMIVARDDDGRLQMLDRIRERVSLAAGLDRDGHLDENARCRAMACLARFGERLRELPAERFRVVGTNTFRKIRDGGLFHREAEMAMGHSIEILGGAEEARLVFMGVRYDIGKTQTPLLAIDIGGGSTELALGSGAVPEIAESVQVGCVSLSTRFFADGKISRKRLDEAIMAASLELEPVADRFAGKDVDVVASSGTALAIEEIAMKCGWSEGGINADALRHIHKALLDAKHIEKVDLKGLSESRRPVIAGGFAAMAAVFQSLRIDQLRTSRGALREGVLIDLAGRMAGVDRRDQSVIHLATRSHVDELQATRVSKSAQQLFEAVASTWPLSAEDGRMLQWAAALHEVGLSISHTDYHRHGEYIAANTDLPGFSRTTQETLAAIIRLHRKRISWHRIPEFGEGTRNCVRDLALLLRVAVHLHRTRTPMSIDNLIASGMPDGLTIHLPSAGANQHPLTMADLTLETKQWTRMGRTLNVLVGLPDQQSAP